MKNPKQFYKDLAHINGFKWSFYDAGFHCFTKGSNRDGFYHLFLIDSDIEDQACFEMMLNKCLTRSAKRF
jgi:hypothetical protein